MKERPGQYWTRKIRCCVVLIERLWKLDQRWKTMGLKSAGQKPNTYRQQGVHYPVRMKRYMEPKTVKMPTVHSFKLCRINDRQNRTIQ